MIDFAEMDLQNGCPLIYFNSFFEKNLNSITFSKISD